MIGILTTPPEAAQEAAERLVEAGVRSILNFAPTVLDVGPEVLVRDVDVALELQILAFHEERRTAGTVAGGVSPRLAIAAAREHAGGVPPGPAGRNKERLLACLSSS